MFRSIQKQAALAVPSAYIAPDLRRWEREQIVKERARGLLTAAIAVAGSEAAATIVEAVNEQDSDFQLATHEQYELLEGLGATLAAFCRELLYRAGHGDQALRREPNVDGILDLIHDTRLDPDFAKAMKRFDM